MKTPWWFPKLREVTGFFIGIGALFFMLVIAWPVVILAHLVNWPFPIWAWPKEKYLAYRRDRHDPPPDLF